MATSAGDNDGCRGYGLNPDKNRSPYRRSYGKILEVLLLSPETTNVVLHALTLGGKALMMSKELTRRDISTV